MSGNTIFFSNVKYSLGRDHSLQTTMCVQLFFEYFPKGSVSATFAGWQGIVFCE